MKAELQEKLFTEHQILYQDKHKGPKVTLMCFGFDCGDGWFDILMGLSSKIEEYNRKNPESPVVATQVKSKFGELRFYIYGGDEHIYKLINAATRKSRKTCELCGSTSQVPQNKEGWIETLCPSCRTKYSTMK